MMCLFIEGFKLFLYDYVNLSDVCELIYFCLFVIDCLGFDLICPNFWLNNWVI